jgi:hypothetical protein
MAIATAMEERVEVAESAKAHETELDPPSVTPAQPLQGQAGWNASPQRNTAWSRASTRQLPRSFDKT